MKRKWIIFIIITVFINTLSAKVKVRIKDLVTITGLRDNQLIGYGIVTGLNGTGDSRRNKLTSRILKTVLANLGLKEEEGINTRNTAVVIVTATLPPVVREGERIDVEVSSIGDARSIAGGVLLQAPLKGADGKVYAVAQGNIVISDTEKRNLTKGIIPGGAIIEENINSQFIKNNKLFLSLKEPDFTTATKIKKGINEKIKEAKVDIINNKTIEVRIPEKYKENVAEFISLIENIEIEPETPARIVINKTSGVVVVNGNVKLLEAGITYKNFDIYVSRKEIIPESGKESMRSFVLQEAEDVKTLINGLNKLGAKTEDIISILYSLKKAGALYAEIIVE